MRLPASIISQQISSQSADPAALRENSELTQEQLAGRLDVDPTYVSLVERGRQGVRWYTVVRFLTALEATPHQLADALDASSIRPGIS